MAKDETLLDAIEKPIVETSKESKETNKRLFAVEKLLKQHLYFIKDSADDNKKVYSELKKLNATAKEGGVGGGKGGGGGATVPDSDKGGSTFIGGIKGKAKKFGAGAKSTFKPKNVLKGGGILTALYGAVEGLEDYKELMKIKPEQETSLKQKISGVTSGIIGALGDLAETVSFGYIKSWKSDDLIKSIDSTINSAFAPIEEHYNKFTTKFPMVGGALDKGFGLINNTLDLVLEGWGNIFDRVGQFGDWAYDAMFDTTEEDRREKANKVGNEKAKILYNERLIKEKEKEIESVKESRDRYEKDSKIYEAFTKQIEGYTEEIKKLQKQNKDTDLKISNIKANSKSAVSSNVTRVGGQRAVDYGSQTKVGGHRNWRNNNQGNIEYGPFAIKHGAVGSDGRFAIFPTMEMGRKAQEALLQTENYQNKTLAGAISRYAPKSENDTQRYISRVSKAIGISPDTPMSSLSDAQRTEMVMAMAKHEGMKAGKVINSKESRVIPTAGGNQGGGQGTQVVQVGGGNQGGGRPSIHDSVSLDNQDNIYNIEASGASLVS